MIPGSAGLGGNQIVEILQLLRSVSDEGHRRMVGAQLNVTEARHRIARLGFFGRRGEPRPSVVTWGSIGFLPLASTRAATDTLRT